MVPGQNPHRPALWGFFFAPSPILSAGVTGLFMDRSPTGLNLHHPSREARSHGRDQRPQPSRSRGRPISSPDHHGGPLPPLVGLHAVNQSPPGGAAPQALVGTLRAKP